jgi:Sec-independent protein secretion pathway component TatC
MQIAFVILALLIVGALVGSALNFAGIFLGIPFVLIFVGVLVMSEGFARQRKVLQMKRFRRDAAAKKVDFSEADKRTLV